MVLILAMMIRGIRVASNSIPGHRRVELLGGTIFYSTIDTNQFDIRIGVFDIGNY